MQAKIICVFHFTGNLCFTIAITIEYSLSAKNDSITNDGRKEFEAPKNDSIHEVCTEMFAS